MSKEKKINSAFILPEMELIINTWGNPDRSPKSYIFPFLHDGLSPEDERKIVKNTTSLINKKMRKIGEALGYGSISTYTARHSYATVLKRSGTNIAYISETLGHSDIKVTENYLANFEDETHKRNARILTNFDTDENS